MTVKVSTNGHKTEARLMPQDRKAEGALIGAVMIDPSSVFEVSAIVQPVSFYVEANGLIFKTMLDLSARGEALDPITIMAELRANGHADIGDDQYRAEAYLANRLIDAPTSLNATNYARIVAEMATRRQMIRASQKIATLAWDEKEPLNEVSEAAQGLVFEATQSQKRRGVNHISLGMGAYLEELERRINNPVEVVGLATGYIDLDKKLNGLRPQELIVIAGRPGMGKTAEMIGMLDQMSVTRGKRGIFFSLEMSEAELRERLLSRRSKIPSLKLSRGDLNETEKERMYEAAGRISQAPIYIMDAAAQTPALIRAECFRQQVTTGLDYILVDYLGLMQVPGVGSRYEKVSDAARAMKNLAKELEVPVILASQLNRSVEMRGDKRPQLSDLRDSGEIEEAADAVIMLYRDEYYKEEDSKYPNIGENIIAKQRNGPTGTIDLYWNAETISYYNLSKRDLLL